MFDPLHQEAPAGQTAALTASTGAFVVCFAAWTIFAIIGVQIRRDLGLNETQFGLLVGLPILTGSLIRLLLGIWSDQFGGRLVMLGVMLSAAVATWLLSYAETYTMLLVAAAGVGIAGGSFASGIAYVSHWYPKQRQGWALGVFGAGNVGAAVTKFLAPMVMVAFGWRAVAEIWAIGLAVSGVLFWLTTKDEPDLVARRAAGRRPESLVSMLQPLARTQVWRFSLYYFFAFGGFVALSLWLPHYYVDVYGLSIVAAGMLGAAYSIPGSLFRILGGSLSDRFGARRVMYWMLLGSLLCCFLLAYPATEYVVQGVHGPIRFSMALGFVPFMVLTMVLGFFMSLGKAAVYKHIPVYYSGHVGAVGGVVGLIGGLGGFVLPIAFGALDDLLGVRTACFMLLFGVCAASLLWMHATVRRMEMRAYPRLREPADLIELQTLRAEVSRLRAANLSATAA